jgi:hypothetical protein
MKNVNQTWSNGTELPFPRMGFVPFKTWHAMYYAFVVGTLNMGCTHAAQAVDATTREQKLIQAAEPGEIAQYFAQREMQGGMGSIIIVPVLGQNTSVCAALIAHQSEFNSKQARTIFWDANIKDKRGFLPLIRREVAAPNYDADALALLSELAPDEARPLIIADLLRERPLFRQRKTYLNFYPYCYLHLPDRPIPELTAYFHQQLQHVDEKFDYNILQLVDRYGTPDLLPDVLRIYEPHAGTWACKIEESCLRFWIRWDRPAGLAALASSRKSRATGCYLSLLDDVVNDRWDMEIQALVLKDLDDSDADIAASAIYVLERRGDASVAEPVVSTYLRLAALAPKDPQISKAMAARWTNPSSGARILIENQRWQLTDEQKHRLEAIALIQH